MNIAQFTLETQWSDLPAKTQQQALRCLVDTVGTGIGGRLTPLSDIIFDFVADVYGEGDAALWLDGRKVTPAGAALANGMTIDSLDSHDGNSITKGHAGAALVPALLALTTIGAEPMSGQELLTSLAIGYEISIRAGIALHDTVADYHTSGAWNTLGCAAMTVRRLGGDASMLAHALGIAEYHGPRSQMMRCIDHPTMVKDGSGWGAMAGVSAGQMALRGFTGAPAITITSGDVADLWADLGQRWYIVEQYFKPFAVCRWAQPAIQAVLWLKEKHNWQLSDIAAVQVHTFHEATRLATRRPADTEQAQYSLPYPVAAALVFGQLGPTELSGAALKDERVLALSDMIQPLEDDHCNEVFPAQRIAKVTLTLNSGEQLHSGEHEPVWEWSAPPSDDELGQKFNWLAGEILPVARVKQIGEAFWGCATLTDAALLNEILSQPAG